MVHPYSIIFLGLLSSLISCVKNYLSLSLQGPRIVLSQNHKSMRQFGHTITHLCPHAHVIPLKTNPPESKPPPSLLKTCCMKTVCVFFQSASFSPLFLSLHTLRYILVLEGRGESFQYFRFMGSFVSYINYFIYNFRVCCHNPNSTTTQLNLT